MTEIMLPVRPKWCELIARGKKTIEVRKFCPKCDVPFKVDIYCTKDKLALLRDAEDVEERYKYDVWNHAKFHESCGKKVLGGKVIGEFVCDKITTVDVLRIFNYMNQGSIHVKDTYAERYLRNSCLSSEETVNYANGKLLIYAWNISDLKIYDKPKQLSEFYVEDTEAIKNCKHRFRWGQPESVTQNGGWIKGGYGCMKNGEPEWCENCLKKTLVRPPQSWQYCERRIQK